MAAFDDESGESPEDDEPVDLEDEDDERLDDDLVIPGVGDDEPEPRSDDDDW
jgi:hypothetical protein